ncbi:MAG: cation transporter, partial [Actinomycetota bacterium]
MGAHLMETQIDLSLTGMSCNACAMTIEKRLNQLDGVTASVNFATESARVVLTDQIVDSATLIREIEKIGYGARLAKDTTLEMLDA